MDKERNRSSIVSVEKEGLKRVLRVRDLFAIGYGDLGSSIYYALGITAAFALGATPIALGLAGIVFVCTALTYAEMTATFHESGGSASFARHAFNDLISFIAGWGLLLDYIVTIAISAFAVGPYLSYFYPDLKITPVHLGFTTGLIAILYVINLLGVRQSTRMSWVLAAFTIVTQAVIILIGFVALFNIPFILDHIRIGVPGVDWSPSWPEFWKGTAMAMVAYTGIESIAQLGAESKKPSKTVPRAVLITMLVLVLMYLGISVVALSAITPQELSTTYVLDPIAGIAAKLPFGSKILGPWIGVLAALLLFVAANAGLVGASRLSFNMGEYYQLPRLFYKLSKRYRTPYISLAFFGIVASLVILLSEGKLERIADLYNFGAMVAFFFVHLSLIVLRIKKPDLKRPFKVPFNISFGKVSIPITALIGCLATFSVWVLIVITKPEGRYLGLSWMVIGVAMYLLYRRNQRLSAMGQITLEKIKIPQYKILDIKHILVPTRGGEQTETVQIACELARMHKAKLTAVHVLEVPPSMPLDIALEHRTLAATAVLRRADAIAREFNVEIDVRIIRSRSTADAIAEELNKGHYDLVVLGSLEPLTQQTKRLGPITQAIIKHTKCRVWVCCSKPNPKGTLGGGKLLEEGSHGFFNWRR